MAFRGKGLLFQICMGRIQHLAKGGILCISLQVLESLSRKPIPSVSVLLGNGHVLASGKSDLACF